MSLPGMDDYISLGISADDGQSFALQIALFDVAASTDIYDNMVFL